MNPPASPNQAQAPQQPGQHAAPLEQLLHDAREAVIYHIGGNIIAHVDRIPTGVQDWALDRFRQLPPARQQEIMAMGRGVVGNVVGHFDAAQNQRRSAAAQTNAAPAPMPKRRQAPIVSSAAQGTNTGNTGQPTKPHAPAGKLIPAQPAANTTAGNPRNPNQNVPAWTTGSTPPPPTRSWHASRHPSHPSQQPTVPVPGNPNNPPTTPNTLTTTNPNRARKPYDLNEYERDLENIYLQRRAELQDRENHYSRLVNDWHKDVASGTAPQTIESSMAPGTVAYNRSVNDILVHYHNKADQLMDNAHDAAMDILNRRPDLARDRDIILEIEKLVQSPDHGLTASADIRKQARGLSPDGKWLAEIVLHRSFRENVGLEHNQHTTLRSNTNSTIGAMRQLLGTIGGSRHVTRHIDPDNPKSELEHITIGVSERTKLFSAVTRMWNDGNERGNAINLQMARLNLAQGAYTNPFDPRNPGASIQTLLSLQDRGEQSHYQERAGSDDVAMRAVGSMDSIIWAQCVQVARGNHPIRNKGAMLVNILRSASSQKMAEIMWYCLTNSNTNYSQASQSAHTPTTHTVGGGHTYGSLPHGQASLPAPIQTP